MWHLSFLNNIIPWQGDDNCMNWTWFIACEMQFFLLVPFLVSAYYYNRHRFWIMILVIWSAASITSLVIIVQNDLSASYFTYNDEYWTIYYQKPYTRLPAYLIGLIFGCHYFSFKHENSEQEFYQNQARRRNLEEDDDPTILNSELRPMPDNLLISTFHKLQDSNIAGLIAVLMGIAVKMILVSIVVQINKEPIDANPFSNLIFLLFQRPVFVIGGSLAIMPFIL